LHRRAKGEEVRALQEALQVYGYGVSVTGRYDDATALVVAAFQRHFRPAHISGEADEETLGVLDKLLELAHLRT
jgi:N-acetyl-anhydromuramyl-L-alanine amidase AmpD